MATLGLGVIVPSAALAYPLARAIDRPEHAVSLAGAVHALPAEIQHYKGLARFREAVLDWLEALAAGPR
jgi:hypothetical protein